MAIEVENNADKVLEEFRAQAIAAMVACGLAGESFAKEAMSKYSWPYGTGALRNSITSETEDQGNKIVTSIGTNMEYGIYVECGTGAYYPGGRDTPWKYKDAKGQWHQTSGMRPRPYIKPALTEHGEEYKAIIEHNLKNG